MSVYLVQLRIADVNWMCSGYGDDDDEGFLMDYDEHGERIDGGVDGFGGA